MHRYFDDDDYADYDDYNDDMRYYNSRKKKKKRTREDLDVINYEPYYLDEYTEQTTNILQLIISFIKMIIDKLTKKS